MRINPQDKKINGERMKNGRYAKAFEQLLPGKCRMRSKKNNSDGRVQLD